MGRHLVTWVWFGDREPSSRGDTGSRGRADPTVRLVELGGHHRRARDGGRDPFRLRAVEAAVVALGHNAREALVVAARLSHVFMMVSDLEAQRRLLVDVVGLRVLLDEGDYLRIGGGDGFHLGLEQGPRVSR